MRNLFRPTSTIRRSGFEPVALSYQRSLSQAEVWGRGVVAALSTTVLVATHFYAQGWRLDSLVHCHFQDLFHIPGPGCGLTRSFMATIQGQWAKAFEFHLFGPILLAGLILVGLVSLVELGSQKKLSLWHQPWLPAVSGLGGVAFALAFLGYYWLRLSVRLHWIDVSSALDHSWLWQFLTSGASLI